ncbi:MAG TPA: nucleotidyl transferase AbiEii/AbiGii toxin family protein [Syntrophales bacterium]|nr:nucleotidyl transferase AbiEii/AbiGii toxin family protein [Syntrophales bacterium]
MRQLNTPFYLTGGTALGRHYFHHRFSDDLDLFVNSEPDYSRHVAQILNALEENQKRLNFSIDYRRLRKEEHYAQIFLTQLADAADLKLDLINDIAVHYGELEHSETMGRIDSWRNILSNKLAAVFRYEAKDFADIWIIAKNKRIVWREIIVEAKTKEAGVDPLALQEILRSFPAEEVTAVKWNMHIDQENFVADLTTIADDIFQGKENSLFQA